MTTKSQQVTNLSALTLYYSETGHGTVEQATEINNVNVPLANFIPGAVYKSSGRPPMNYFHNRYGWLGFAEAVKG